VVSAGASNAANTAAATFSSSDGDPIEPVG